MCRGSGGECDPAEQCPRAADAACPADSFEPDGTECGNPGDGVCDLQDTCDGSGACDDNVEPTGTDCANDDSFCNGDEVCSATGTCESPGDPCPGTECNTCQEESDTCFDDPGTGCGDGADNECTDPDTCDGDGFCQPNNEACAAVTDSGLCSFDVSPKGVCVDGGVPTGEPCDPDPSLGETCDVGTCEPENQFRLLFTPDGKNWPAHKLVASNPGQTFYNLMSDNSGCTAGDAVTFEIEVPYPYVTVGAMPVHVYDGALVGTIPDPDNPDQECFVPEAALDEFGSQLNIEDWFSGAAIAGWMCPDLDPLLANQPMVPSFTCILTVVTEYPASCQLYVNVHLDYGLKGPQLDWNPGEGNPDRYDPDNVSAWVSYDALVDETQTTLGGAVGIEDCKDMTFSHEEVMGGIGDSFSDTVQNLNIFKRPAGAFGFVSTSSDGQGAGGVGLSLVHPTNGVVHTGETDEDGYYLLNYKHKGKPTVYTIVLDNGSGLSGEAPLKGNGFVEVNFDLTTGTATTEGDEKPGNQGKSGQ